MGRSMLRPYENLSQNVDEHIPNLLLFVPNEKRITRTFDGDKVRWVQSA